MTGPIGKSVNINISDSCNSCCPCLPSSRRKREATEANLRALAEIKAKDEIPSTDVKVEGAATVIMKEINE
jgi:hypothetical protein